MKKLLFSYCIALMVVCFSLALVAQPENIVINNSGQYSRKQRAPVAFPHIRHMGSVPCNACHHRYQDGKNVINDSVLQPGMPGIKCADCHGLRSGNRHPLREAFHAQCIGCHGKMIRAGKKSGPRLCGECHPWK